MRLKQLIDNSGQSEFILIHDNKDVKGDRLLIEFIKQNVVLGNKTDLLCIEKNPVILKHLPVANNFNCHQFNDTQSWLENNKDSVEKSDGDLFKFLLQMHTRSIPNSRNVLVVDSLALLLLLYPKKCYRAISNLLNSLFPGSLQCQIICLLHSDVVPNERNMILMFERLASTNVYIEQYNKQPQVTIKHRKASGRVIEITEQFFFDQSLNLVTKEIVKTKESQVEDDNKDWMTKDVTFKLQLEDEEKRARSELVLPYLKTNNKAASGEIYYEPDASDDWDEEDPDDDLNI